MSHRIRRTALALAIAAPACVAQPSGAQTSQAGSADAGRHFVSPGMRGFEIRRKNGLGQFVTDSALRAASGARLSHVLTRHMPQLLFGAGNSAGEFPISARVCGGGLACAAPRCYVRIFVDGTLMFDGTPRLLDIEGADVSHWRTEDFSGIEYYASPAGVPSQYAGRNSDCGTLLFWSRET
jgi:hypothetical protein